MECVYVNVGFFDAYVVASMVACALLMARVFVLSRRTVRLERERDDWRWACVHKDDAVSLKADSYMCTHCGNTELGRVHCYMCEMD